MAEQKGSEQKSLEMRVAELEDKISKIHITEDELKAYHKVTGLMGGHAVADVAAAPTTAQLSPQVCAISRAVSRSISPRGITPIINRGIIGECYECSCGPCNVGGGGGGFTGGFGGLGQ